MNFKRTVNDLFHKFKTIQKKAEKTFVPKKPGDNTNFREAKMNLKGPQELQHDVRDRLVDLQKKIAGSELAPEDRNEQDQEIIQAYLEEYFRNDDTMLRRIATLLNKPKEEIKFNKTEARQIARFSNTEFLNGTQENVGFPILPLYDYLFTLDDILQELNVLEQLVNSLDDLKPEDLPNFDKQILPADHRPWEFVDRIEVGTMSGAYDVTTGQVLGSKRIIKFDRIKDIDNVPVPLPDEPLEKPPVDKQITEIPKKPTVDKLDIKHVEKKPTEEKPTEEKPDEEDIKKKDVKKEDKVEVGLDEKKHQQQIEKERERFKKNLPKDLQKYSDEILKEFAGDDSVDNYLLTVGSSLTIDKTDPIITQFREKKSKEEEVKKEESNIVNMDIGDYTGELIRDQEEKEDYNDYARNVIEQISNMNDNLKNNIIGGKIIDKIEKLIANKGNLKGVIRKPLGWELDNIDFSTYKKGKYAHLDGKIDLSGKILEDVELEKKNVETFVDKLLRSKTSNKEQAINKALGRLNNLYKLANDKQKILRAVEMLNKDGDKSFPGDVVKFVEDHKIDVNDEKLDFGFSQEQLDKIEAAFEVKRGGAGDIIKREKEEKKSPSTIKKAFGTGILVLGTLIGLRNAMTPYTNANATHIMEMDNNVGNLQAKFVDSYDFGADFKNHDILKDVGEIQSVQSNLNDLPREQLARAIAFEKTLTIPLEHEEQELDDLKDALDDLDMKQKRVKGVIAKEKVEKEIIRAKEKVLEKKSDVDISKKTYLLNDDVAGLNIPQYDKVDEKIEDIAKSYADGIRSAGKLMKLSSDVKHPKALIDDSDYKKFIDASKEFVELNENLSVYINARKDAVQKYVESLKELEDPTREDIDTIEEYPKQIGKWDKFVEIKNRELDNKVESLKKIRRDMVEKFQDVDIQEFPKPWSKKIRVPSNKFKYSDEVKSETDRISNQLKRKTKAQVLKDEDVSIISRIDLERAVPYLPDQVARETAEVLNNKIINNLTSIVTGGFKTTGKWHKYFEKFADNIYEKVKEVRLADKNVLVKAWYKIFSDDTSKKITSMILTGSFGIFTTLVAQIFGRMVKDVKARKQAKKSADKIFRETVKGWQQKGPLYKFAFLQYFIAPALALYTGGASAALTASVTSLLPHMFSKEEARKIGEEFKKPRRRRRPPARRDFSASIVPRFPFKATLSLSGIRNKTNYELCCDEAKLLGVPVLREMTAVGQGLYKILYSWTPKNIDPAEQYWVNALGYDYQMEVIDGFAKMKKNVVFKDMDEMKDHDYIKNPIGTLALAKHTKIKNYPNNYMGIRMVHIDNAVVETVKEAKEKYGYKEKLGGHDIPRKGGAIGLWKISINDDSEIQPSQPDLKLNNTSQDIIKYNETGEKIKAETYTMEEIYEAYKAWKNHPLRHCEQFSRIYQQSIEPLLHARYNNIQKKYSAQRLITPLKIDVVNVLKTHDNKGRGELLKAQIFCPSGLMPVFKDFQGRELKNPYIMIKGEKFLSPLVDAKQTTCVPIIEAEELKKEVEKVVVPLIPKFHKEVRKGKLDKKLARDLLAKAEEDAKDDEFFKKKKKKKPPTDEVKLQEPPSFDDVHKKVRKDKKIIPKLPTF